MLKASHNIHYCKSLRDFTEIMPSFDLLSVSKVSYMIWEQHVSSLRGYTTICGKFLVRFQKFEKHPNCPVRMFLSRVSHLPAFKKILTVKIFWNESPTPLKVARSGVRFKKFSRTPDVQISKIVFLSDETQNFRTFYREFWRNSKNSNFFNIENCNFSDENRKKLRFLA